MNWEKFVAYILIFAVIALLVTFMSKAASKAIKPSSNGEYMLKLHGLYLIVGFLGISIGCIGIVVFLFYKDLEMLYFAVGMNVIFTPLGLVCGLWYKNHRLKYDNFKVIAISWLGKSQ